MADPKLILSRRFVTALLVALGVLAMAAGSALTFASVTSHGSDCGSVVFPQEPSPSDPNFLLAGCGGARFGRLALVIVCALVMVACVVVLLKRRRTARSSPDHAT